MNTLRCAAVLAVFLLAACAQPATSAAPPRPTTSAPTTTVPPTTSAPDSTTSTVASTPAPSAAPTPGHPAPPPGCAAGAVELEIRAQPGPRPALCLRTGAQLRFTAESSPRQPWQPLVSSAPSVLSCASHPAVEGSVAGVCTALAPGGTTLTTSTSAFAGDPHGPPQIAWTLTVTVVG